MLPKLLHNEITFPRPYLGCMMTWTPSARAWTRAMQSLRSSWQRSSSITGMASLRVINWRSCSYITLLYCMLWCLGNPTTMFEIVHIIMNMHKYLNAFTWLLTQTSQLGGVMFGWGLLPLSFHAWMATVATVMKIGFKNCSNTTGRPLC